MSTIQADIDLTELPCHLANFNLDGNFDNSPGFVQDRNPPHYWIDVEKQFLCVLYRFFVLAEHDIVRNLSQRELRDIFVFYFKKDLPVTRKVEKISSSAVHNQLYKMQRLRHRDEVWKVVFEGTKFNNPFALWKKELLGIDLAALNLKLNLVPRARDGMLAALQGLARHSFDNELAKLTHRPCFGQRSE